MAFYARLYNWTQDASNNIGILASKQDGEWNNLVPAVNRCWDTQGTNTPTGNMNMGGFKLINGAAGVSSTDFAILSQIQGSSFSYAVATGSAGNFIVALTPPATSYTSGMVVRFQSNQSTTGATTINVNGLGVINIKKNTNLATQSGDLLTNQLVTLVYDGTNFQIVSPLNGTLTQNGLSIFAADTGSANVYAVALSPVIVAYTTGQVVNFQATNTNTGASTLNVNSLGAIAIKKSQAAALVANDIIASQIVSVIYDGTNFQLLSPAFGQVTQNGASIFNTTTGSANAYVLTLSPAVPSYVTGMVIRFIANFGNTGASTIAVNGLSAIAIKKFGSTALASGDIANNQAVEAMYDGTNFQLMVIPGTAGGSVTSVATAGLATGGTITTTGTITVTAAVKSDQTTGTSTTVAVVPAIQQNHTSAAKAWANVAIQNPTIIAASYNITSITFSSTGVAAWVFTTNFTSTAYVPLFCNIQVTSSTSRSGTLIENGTTLAVSGFTTATFGDSGALTNSTVFCACFGTQ